MAASIVRRKRATDDLVPVAPESAVRRVRLTRVEERNDEWIYGDEVDLGEVAHAPRDLRIDQPDGGTQLKGQLVCREIIASTILASPPCVDLMKRATEEQILSSGENKVRGSY